MFGTFLAQIAYAYNFQAPEKLNDFFDQGFFPTNSKILSKFYWDKFYCRMSLSK